MTNDERVENTLKEKVLINPESGFFYIVFGNYVYGKRKLSLLSEEKLKKFKEDLDNSYYLDLYHYDLEDLLEVLLEDFDKYNIGKDLPFINEGRIICVKHNNQMMIGLISKIELIDSNKHDFSIKNIKKILVITEYGHKLLIDGTNINENISKVTGMEDIIIDNIIEILNFYNINDNFKINLEDFLTNR